MNVYFVYLLVIKAFVDSCKIGSTQDPYNRHGNYGGYFSSEKYEMYLLQILKLPLTHRMECKKKYNYRYHEYVEKELLHKHYKIFSVINPSSNTKNEFFTCDITMYNICSILKENGLQEGVHFRERTENILECEEYKKISRSKTKKKVDEHEIDEHVYDEADVEQDIEDYYMYILFHRWYNRVFPIKRFIEEQILRNKLRDIQTNLYVEIQKKLNKEECIKGIVKWATGVGKRIGIIICILLLNEHYSKKRKPCRLVLCSHRNDIFGGKAMRDYELLDKKGIKIIKGTHGKFKESLEEITSCDADNRSWLLITTHQALTGTDEDISNFKNLHKDVLIYDEVQRITGDQLYKSILDNMPEHLLGFSGTPFTSDEEQNKKLLQLFGLEKEEYISQCSCLEAIAKGYINNFKINIHLLQSDEDIHRYAKEATLMTIDRRKQDNMWLHKKIIHNCGSKIDYIKSAYTAFEGTDITRFIPEQNEKQLKELLCKTNVSSFEKVLNSNDDEILFTCQTYREGSDISGIEFVNIVIEGDKALHLIAQIKGRADRIDYPNQLSETNIFISDKEDTVPKLLTGLSNELDIPINDIHNYVDVVNSSHDTQIETESQRELREHNEKTKELEQKVLKETLEKMNKDKSDLQNKIKIYQDKQKISYVSKDKFIEICNELNIRLHKDALERIDEINKKNNLKMTEANIHDLNIEWYKFNPEYYQNPVECIESIKKIFYNNKKEIRLMKRKDRHKYFNSIDPKIPPYDKVKDLLLYYGDNKYTLSHFKLD